MLGTTNSIVRTIVEYRVGVTLQWMDLSHVHTIYIDESSWRVGHNYRLLTVISKIYDYGDKQVADFYFELWYEDVSR